MAKFPYNNRKNASISYILFKLNSGFYFIVFLKDFDFCSKSKATNKLKTKLKKLIIIYCKNI